MLKLPKLSCVWKLGHIIRKRCLKNTTNNNQLPYEWKVLKLLDMKLTLQFLEAPIPHGDYRQPNSKRNPSISFSNANLNIRANNRDPILGGYLNLLNKIKFYEK